MDIPGLLDVAEELYGGSLDEFTSTRNARAAAAKKAGDRDLAAAITGLKKPSASAWVGNLLVRSSSVAITGLAELRDEISQASLGGDRDALKELSSRRHSFIAALVVEARKLAETMAKPLSDAAASELADALGAALTDPDIAAALSTGRLIAAPEPGGTTRRDLALIVAVPPEELSSVDQDDDEPDVDSEPDSTGPRSGRSSTRRSTDRGKSARRSSGSSAERGRTAGRASGAGSAERRRRERDLEAAEARAAEARADREKREGERDALATKRDEIAEEVTRQRDALRSLERRLDDADEAVAARTADIRARELDWKRAEAAARSARRAMEAGAAP